MNFLHYGMGNVSRSSGRSCVQAVAYIIRGHIFEERRQLHAYYEHLKRHETFWETLAPEGSGIANNDVSIWNKVDLAEDDLLTRRYKDPETRSKKIGQAVPAYSDRFALPKELPREENIELVREILQERFVSRGLVVTYAIHWEEGNPHVHFVYSSRPFKDGAFSEVKTASRETRGPKGGRETRSIAAHIINTYQKRAGLSDRVDPRSYAERGLDLIPTRHKGWKAHNLERDGEYSRIAEENRQIFEENRERVSEAPGLVLKELTTTQATFSETDVMRVVQNRFKGDLEILGEHVFHNVMEQAVQVGENIYGQTRYTTPEYDEKESRILQSLEAFQAGKSSVPIDPATVDAWIGKLIEEGQESANNKGHAPNAGQVAAIRALCGDSQLMVMVGRAGTGKTTTLKSVVRLHQEAGYAVWGMAPSATAAAQLEADTGCKSDTLAHYAYYWKEFERAQELLNRAETDQETRDANALLDKCASYLPDERTVIIVDEAGMVGVGDAAGHIPGGWDALAKVLGGSGVKLILVGDDHQYKPVEAGDIFRRLVHQLKGTPHLCELSEIVRQRIPWMREASQHLSDLNVATALGMYEQQGHVEAYGNSEEVYGAIARQYLRNILREPDSSGFVVAATHEEIRAINREIRSLLRDNGFLPQEDAFKRGEDGYAVGDNILFTKNDRGWDTAFTCQDDRFFVRNSMQGVIQSVKSHMTENAEGGKEKRFEVTVSVPAHEATVSFFLDEYSHFTHGYAGTGHKSQGATLDWVLVKLSRYMDAHALYVTLTRHREDITLYYAQDQFPDYKSLVNSLSRANVKDLVVDYTITDEHEGYWQTVQEYTEACRERLAAGRLINSLDKTRDREEIEGLWQAYRDIQEDQKSLATCILRDWDEHRDFVRQAGLTRESLEIVAGVKKRPLSRLETQALLTVEQYVSSAFQCRVLWRDIRRTHPGVRAKDHPDWGRFEEARNQRGILANQICLAPALHFPFLKETAGRLQKQPCAASSSQAVSWSRWTVHAQAEAHQSKILQEALMRDGSDLQRKDRLQALIAYTEYRDMAASLWQGIRPKLKPLEGTLLKGSCGKEIAEFTGIKRERDAAALKIFHNLEAFVGLAAKVGIRIDVEKLTEQAEQGKRDQVIAAYKDSRDKGEELANLSRFEAAHTLSLMMREEASSKKRPKTASSLYEHGLTPQEVGQDALRYPKAKVFSQLPPGPSHERELFTLLDAYDEKCRTANSLYALCARDAENQVASGHPEAKPWHSPHYSAYRAACQERNEDAFALFDQKDFGKVMAMAESMGMRFKDVDLEEVLSRCEQATRTRHIAAYLKAETPDSKGEAALALTQMIAFEKRQGGTERYARNGANPSLTNANGKGGNPASKASPTASQAFHAGIDFKELQDTAFAYGRACTLKNLSNPDEVKIFQNLERYEQSTHAAKKMYVACIEESKARTAKGTAKGKEVKPWETEAFKGYISLVTVQDEQAHELVKGYPAALVEKVSREMGVSLKGMDVEAHRHSLRQTLQTFTEGDRTNVPMAAFELLHWLEFDHHADYKHTFKVLRERDLWPKDIQDSLKEFFGKKRELRRSQGRSDERESHGEPASYAYLRTQLRPYREIEQALCSRMGELATDILGKPSSCSSKGWRFGSKGSMLVSVRGDRQGRFHNFETGEGGGPIDLIKQQLGLAFRDAAKWASDWLGDTPTIVERQRPEKGKGPEGLGQKRSTWTPITPVPGEAGDPDIAGNPYLNYMLKEGARETHRHAYRDEDGRLKGYVIRIEKADGSKVTPPLAYCQNEKGFKAWRWQGFETGAKTPYGIEKLAQDPGKPILVVEGEKTCDAAQKLFPDYHVLTWGGGAGNVGKTDWQCFTGKNVAIWPDYDQGGLIAAQKLQRIVTNLNRDAGAEGRASIVDLPPLTPGKPPLLPNKWDLADPLPERWTIDTVRQMVKDAIQVEEKSSEAQGCLSSEPVPHSISSPAPATGLARDYTFDEQKILVYLKNELSLEKNFWLDQDLIDTYMKAAEKNPAKMLQRWQEITDDHSFNASAQEAAKPLTDQQRLAEWQTPPTKATAGEMQKSPLTQGSEITEKNQQREKGIDIHEPQEPSVPLNEETGAQTPETPPTSLSPLLTEEKTLTPQASEIMAYLTEEVSRSKHDWLTEPFCNKVFDLAAKDPLAALQKWQRVSRDFSFEPSTPNNLMTPEQKELRDDILSYLEEAVQPDPEKRIKERDCQRILELAKKKPEKGLNEWQTLTLDFEFNPFRDKLNSRETAVFEFMKEKLEDPDTVLSKSAMADITQHLLKNPLKAYEEWQAYSFDKTFDPQTGIPTAEIKARELMDSLKGRVSAGTFQYWQNIVIQSPAAVTHECNEALKAIREDREISAIARKYVSLCEQYEKMGWRHDRIKLSETIDSIAEAHLRDERFVEKVEQSKSEAAITRLAEEIQAQERIRSREMDHGMDM